MVPPDFEETRKSVCRGSCAAVTARTAAGDVLSSTVSSRNLGATPSMRRMTSGARLDPPMPRSTAWVKPSALTSATKASSAATSPRMPAGRSSQPRRFAATF